MGILERIAEIELEMSRTQKHKHSEHHLGLLKARLAKYVRALKIFAGFITEILVERLRSQLLEPPKTGKSGGEGFEVSKHGDARVCIIGFPSVGKSTLLSMLTPTVSEVSEIEFTTLTAIPGNITYKDARIQLLDTPGIIEGASSGKGRGRQVLAITRTADLIVLILDPTKEVAQRRILEHELESTGIRINQQPPDITITKRKYGGITLNSTVPLNNISYETVKVIMHEYKIHNADVLFRCDATVDQFIDAVEGRKSYISCIYIYNKIDCLNFEEIEKFASRDQSLVISCELDLNLDYLVEVIWQNLGLLRIYTKKRGESPSLTDPLIMRVNSNVKDLCDGIHREMKNFFKYALVWGTSVKYSPQRVGLSHQLCDEDVVEIHTK